MKNIFEIFYRFFILGLFSFGGPVAHLGYFRKEFVEKLQWLSEESYSKIVALSQFLPGPSSSQVGFTIGLKKGGLAGAIAAFVAFTLPSFLLLYFLATLQIENTQSSLINSIISGLKLFAVVIVADAIIAMFGNFCKTRFTLFIFVLSSLILLLFQNFFVQILVIILSGIIAMIFLKSNAQTEQKQYEKPRILPLLLFIIPFVFSLFFVCSNELLVLFDSFYKVGSLVFGGGHVVLPLIAQTVPVEENSFLVGYALAQAVPGPMFTIASYLGAVSIPNNAFLGALIATLAIFLPGFLLILAFEKSFESYSKKPKIASAIIGINASVVALLFVALCDPIFVSGVKGILDFVVALGVLVVLRKYKISIFYCIAFCCVYAIVF